MARHIRYAGRSGFTLIEVLMAASITAAACAAATMLIQTINQNASASSEQHADVTTARDALLCIDMLVQEAALVGYWDDSQVLLWRDDDNDDGQINLSELTLIRYDAEDQCLSLRDVPISAGQNPVVRLNQFVTTAAVQTVQQHASLRVRPMIGGLSSLQTWCDATGDAAQVVQMTLAVGSGDEAQTLHAVMSLRNRTRKAVP